MRGSGTISQLLFALYLQASRADTLCERDIPCVTGIGSDSFNNSELIPTAVGCTKTVDVRFQPSEGNSSIEVLMCEYDSTGTCVYRPGVILDSFHRGCCQQPFQARDSRCSAAGQEHAPLSIFQCIQLGYTHHEHGHITAHITFLAPFQADLSNAGQAQACIRARHPPDGELSEPYCLLFHIQRCAVCLQEGQGLTAIAKEYGTHWTQIYSANPGISSNPDALAVGQLVRVGNVYRIEEGDTLAGVALKFGVTVNQLFFWNRHLIPLPDTGGYGSYKHLSRDLPVGLDICVSPKTCLDSFAEEQPLYFAGDGVEEGGGGWADPPQVVAEL